MKRYIAVFMTMIMFFSLQVNVFAAATPTFAERGEYYSDCYYHYDGKIWVYSTSKYKSETRSAIKLLNKKFKAFCYTTSKTKRDVWVRDKSKLFSYRVCALTVNDSGNIYLYRPNMKKLTKKLRILVIAHELCHAAGLARASGRSSLMYPYVDKIKTYGLSSADVKALKKARNYAQERNKQRRAVLNSLIGIEKRNLRVGLRYRSDGKNSWIFAFPKRGTTYRSSNTSIMQVLQTGKVTVKRPGKVRLTVNNAGTKHVFYFTIIR